jgi:hypothetical protein
MAERIGRDQCIDCGGALTHSRVVFFRRDDAGVLRSVPGAFQCLDCATTPKRPLTAL